ncbi:MAG: hypothetical protein ACT4OF_07155 [Caulobacteraceae bacterium]
MTGYDFVMTALVVSGSVIAVLALLSARRLDRLEREIAARKATQRPAE